MKLHMPTSTEYATLIVSNGFVGTRRMYEPSADNDGQPDYGKPLPELLCELRDMPPTGLTFSRATDAEVAEDGTEHHDHDQRTVDARRPRRLRDGIEVPDDIAAEGLVTERPGRLGKFADVGEAEPMSWPFREYWLPESLVNQYRHTPHAFDSRDGRGAARPRRQVSSRR